MKKSMPYIILNSLLLTGFIVAALVFFAPEKKPPAVMGAGGERTTVLNVSVLDYGTYFTRAANRFMDIHPEVEIILHNPCNQPRDNMGFIASYRQQIRDQMASGEFDDLLEIFDNGYIGGDLARIFPFYQAADFYPLMQKDADFAEADYYMNVVNSLAYQNKLLAFPLYFSYRGIAVNSTFSPQLAEQFKQYEQITYREVFDLYNSLEDKGNRYISGILSPLNSLEANITTFVNFEKKECYFNTPEFIEFISAAKEGVDPLSKYNFGLEVRLGNSFYWNDNGSFDEIMQKEYALRHLFYVDSINPYQFLLPEGEGKKFTHYIPLVTEDGEAILFPMRAFMINKDSKNKELAWEFIKFLASTQSVAYYRDDYHVYPVNKQIFNNQVNAYVFKITESMKSLKQGEPALTAEEVVAKLTAYSEMPMQSTLYLEAGLEVLLQKILTPFYKGAISAEQAAVQLQQEVTQYLKKN